MAAAVLTGALRKKSNSHGMNQLRWFEFNLTTCSLQYSEANGESVKGSGTVTAIGDYPDGGWFMFRRRHRVNIYMEHRQRGGASVVECTAASAEQKREWLDGVRGALLGTSMIEMPPADDGQDPLPPAPTLPVAIPCQPDHGHVKCHSRRGTWTCDDFTKGLLDSAPPLSAGGGGGGLSFWSGLSAVGGSAAGSHGTPFGSYFPASSYESRSEINHRFAAAAAAAAEAAWRDQARAEAAERARAETEHMRAADQARAEAAEQARAEAVERVTEREREAAAAAEKGKELRVELAQVKQEKATAEAEAEDRAQCVVCMEADRAVLFQPCGHAVACAACAAGLRECPVCRGAVEQTVPFFT
jgi:hypothetical protein